MIDSVLNYSHRQDRQCKSQRNIEARSRNHHCREKPISITYSQCVSTAFV